VRDHNLPNAAFTGFVTGVLIGSGLGLLLAPASGRTTRARVSYRLRETAEAARELKERMNHRLRETAGSARGLKERLRDRLRPATATAVEPRAS
jgi:gas vesicle protein